MKKRLSLIALLICLAVLGATAQTNKVYKADTVIDGNGNKIITVYSQGTFAEGDGNVVTHDYDLAMFDEINNVLPATINYTVADNYSCRVTLDENLFEYIDIYRGHLAQPACGYGESGKVAKEQIMLKIRIS